VKFSIADAARAMSATGPAPSTLSGEVSSFSIDSRTAQKGDLFFAIKGDVHDGHKFAGQALDGGAAAVVVQEDIGRSERVLRVDDTLAALQRLAQWGCRKWGGRVVGVTGSAGKTTTKDVIASILASTLSVGKTFGNFNNHVGLPLSVLRVPQEAEVAVLEYGMNHSGEIAALAELVPPDIAVVTNVGHAHIENFESVEGIAAAKRELVEALPPGGMAVLNYDDERVRKFATADTIYYGLEQGAHVRAIHIELSAAGVRFEVDGVQFESSMQGRHAIRNILAGLAVGRLFRIHPADVVEAVRALAPGKMRGERLRHGGIEIINDCYNSNPDAARGMLDVLRELPAQRKIAVLGEMLELGRWSEPLHRDVGDYAVRCGVSVLVGIRGDARFLVESAVDAGLSSDAAFFFDDPEQAGLHLRSIAREGDAILFKGSRGTRVEKALEKFLE
jgi:UDP-N-acetylmuramoyl-tripeptide--D-alanyl-D-alanine ligase